MLASFIPFSRYELKHYKRDKSYNAVIKVLLVIVYPLFKKVGAAALV